MKITRAWLQEREACRKGLKLFDEHYPGGEADHNEVLRRLSATEDKEISGFGEWLVDEIGFIDETLELSDVYDGPALYYCGNVKTPKDIRAKFRIRVGGDVTADGNLEAGGDVKAGGNVEAAGDVKAGRSVRAGGFVHVGGSVRAGLDVSKGGNVRAGGFVRAGWSVSASGDVQAGGFVSANRSVHAGWSVWAREFVEAGGFVEAGDDINTGDGYSVSAGLTVPRELWPEQGFIKSKNKPNILSGHWAGE